MPSRKGKKGTRRQGFVPDAYRSTSSQCWNSSENSLYPLRRQKNNPLSFWKVLLGIPVLLNGIGIFSFYPAVILRPGFLIQKYGVPAQRQVPPRLAVRQTSGSLPQFVPNWVFRPFPFIHTCLMFLVVLREEGIKKFPESKKPKASNKREIND